jgi:hypothetical protein
MPPRLKSNEANLHNERTPPRESETAARGETIILQSIISGVLLIFILMISMLNAAPTAVLRDGLREILSGANTPQELMTDVRSFGGEFFGWGPALPKETPQEIQQIPAQTQAPAQPQEAFELPVTPTLTTEETSNPQIPGSSAAPELWVLPNGFLP